MILLIDNYDSFVYNLARYLTELGCETCVVRNDQLAVKELADAQPQAIVISPGPCTPNEAGISMEIVRQLSPTIPTLGVCLGHQAIAAALGGRINRAPEPVHGRTSPVDHDGRELFEGLPNPLRATRYHSLIVDEESLPPSLEVTARTPDGLPMALRHREWPLFGVQFHPESVLTEGGHRLLTNFMALAGIKAAAPRQYREMQTEIRWQASNSRAYWAPRDDSPENEFAACLPMPSRLPGSVGHENPATRHVPLG